MMVAEEQYPEDSIFEAVEKACTSKAELLKTIGQCRRMKDALRQANKPHAIKKT